MRRTYHIDVDDIRKRSKGFCDLEAPYLWFNEFIKQDEKRQWEYVSDPTHMVTFSSYPNKSKISYDIPHSEEFNQKERFIHYLGKESFVPTSYIISPSSWKDFEKILSVDFTGLWFLKKAGKGIGGGYDVKPIIYRNNLQFLKDIRDEIQEMNIHPLYRRKVFILQKGIDKPLLTPTGEKFDLRIYMMLVGTRNFLLSYICKLGDIRIASEKYNPNCLDTRVQVTNTSQNKKHKSLTQIKQKFSEEDNGEFYRLTFPKIKQIARRIADIYGPVILEQERSHKTELNPTIKPFFGLIGLDIIIDSIDGKPYLIELNRRPGVGRPEEEMKYNFSNKIFMKDVYEKGLCFFTDSDPISSDIESSFVLIRKLQIKAG